MKRPDLHEKHPKFYTKEGWLRPYAFACGYIHEQWLDCSRYRIILKHNGGTNYTVNVSFEGRLIVWDDVANLTHGRRLYSSTVRIIKEGGDDNRIRGKIRLNAWRLKRKYNKES